MVSSVLCVAIRRTAAGRYFLRTAAAADRCGTRYGFLSCGRVRECRHLESSSVVKVFAIPGSGRGTKRGAVKYSLIRLMCLSLSGLRSCLGFSPIYTMDLMNSDS
eukprot:scaffold47378_cov59-Phaeocystis_antarctica.AAC.6